MIVLAILIGLLIGSFLNVCIYRIPEGGSIAYPSSHCQTCKTSLKPVDLIPVLSYLFYKGRCRYCGEKISVQYPVVEFLNAIIYLFLYLQFGFTLKMIGLAILCSLLIVIAFIDFKLQIIPDELIVFGIAAGLLWNIGHWNLSFFLNGLIGLAIGGGLFLIIAILSGGAMGGGDIKLMGVLGLWFGWKLILLTMLLSFVIGAVLSVLLLLLKIKKRKDTIPFGPFIAIGAFIAIYYGNEILDFYLKLTY